MDLQPNGCRVVILPFDEVSDDGHCNLAIAGTLNQARLAEVVYGMTAVTLGNLLFATTQERISWASRVAESISSQNSDWVAIPGCAESPSGSTTLRVVNEFDGPALLIWGWGEARTRDLHNPKQTFPSLLTSWKTAAEGYPLMTEAERKLQALSVMPPAYVERLMKEASWNWTGSLRQLLEFGLGLFQSLQANIGPGDLGSG